MCVVGGGGRWECGIAEMAVDEASGDVVSRRVWPGTQQPERSFRRVRGQTLQRWCCTGSKTKMATQ